MGILITHRSLTKTNFSLKWGKNNIGVSVIRLNLYKIFVFEKVRYVRPDLLYSKISAVAVAALTAPLPQAIFLIAQCLLYTLLVVQQ